MKTYNEGLGSRMFDVFNYALMVALCVIMLYPLLNTFSISLSDPDLIAQGKISWYPQGFTIDGYSFIFQSNDLLRAYKNTLIYVLVGTVLQLLLTSLFSYPLSMGNFVLRKPLTIFVIITMVFGGGLIPTYMLIRNLHLLDTLWVIVLPGALSAFNIIIFRTFFQEIPKELRESAYLDGANDMKILFRIYMPLSKALLATFALFGAVGFWNMWFEAMIYLNDMRLHPIQMLLRRMIVELKDMNDHGGLQRYVEMHNVNPKNIKMATVIVTILPILFVYPFVQRHFVTGMLVGSVKG
ncbi:carbohydrate ABC transporter permease [Paenibacillus mendelii]|uniref:Carbohydrate ABC transporter permease n=1 Tax=Paenibacillus mendelii TaxID=206163 RepID=A0ABV6JFG9_9BACL|nr:carbohydrate ABC transporter permease [Paenibacillus mendelii]MCQ6557491.1 carbohydrate ABC transporter permease [Paenibacillus mendelii]